jgi:hypothetical protein
LSTQISVPVDIRRSLKEALERLPQAGSAAGRDDLLDGIPHDRFNRDLYNLAVDVSLIVGQVEGNFSIDGKWHLLQLVENAIVRAKGTELGRDLVAIRNALEALLDDFRKAHLGPEEVAQIHLFDLTEPVKTCLNSLPEEPCTCGFLLHVPVLRPLKCFCESLAHRGAKQERWTRAQVSVRKVPLVVKVPHASMERAFKGACEHKAQLDSKIVICGVHVHEIGDAPALWSKLRREFGGKLKNRFIVVFGMPEGSAAPRGMKTLPPPKFTPAHVSEWIGPIVNSMPWKKDNDLVERWTRMIVAEYHDSEDGLPIDWLYEQLEVHRDLVTTYRTEKAFKKRFTELAAMGG